MDQQLPPSGALKANPIPEPEMRSGLGSLYAMMEAPRVGDTGTTPRNERESFFLNRNTNMSIDERTNPTLFSPFMG